MITAELLRKKRDGEALGEREIAFLVRGAVTGEVSHAQVAAFLMASCIRGLVPAETASLTRAMAQSGTMFDFSGVGRPVADKHSTGGVGDKISLILAPLAAACGIAVPMISGRGLGHTGGTVDKLESIAGMRLELSDDEYHDLVRRNGVFMAKQTDAIAPADRVLYHLRDVTGTVESVGLLTSSILSKKLAEGLDALVMDVKVGRGAFLPTFGEASVLARSLYDVGREAGLPVRVVFTAMNQPLGRAVGNWVEVEEAVEALAGAPADDVRVVTEELCAAMLLAVRTVDSREQALERVRTVWRSGEALAVFQRMVQAQGGDMERSRREYADVPRVAVIAEDEGFITGIHARTIGMAAVALGVGRVRSEDAVDYAAGIVFAKKTGDRVRRGEEIAVVQGRRTETFGDVQAMVRNAVSTGGKAPEPEALILGEIV